MRKIIQNSSKRNSSQGRSIIITIIVVVALLIGLFYAFLFLLTAGVFINLFLIRPVQVAGSAMAPTYNNGMYLMAKVIHSNNVVLNRGDVIVFKAPQNPNFEYLQRVVGLPGETVMLKSNEVYINDQKLDDSSYLSPGTQTSAGAYLKEGETAFIPDGQYFVLGDNRTHSNDSRAWGPVPQQSITAKIAFCYWNCGNK